MGKKIVLQIIGMHCSTCAQRIEKTLSRVSGVRDVSVSFAPKEVIIECNPDEMDLGEIGKIIEDIAAHDFGDQ